MTVKTLSFIAAGILATGAASYAADFRATPTQLALVPSALSAPATARQLIVKTPLAWPKEVPQTREAKVVLRYTIEPDGSVDNIETELGSNLDFILAARRSVTNWRYAPAVTATPNAEVVAYFHAAH